MTLRQLSYFLAVAEELSFTAAALKCNVSQPPISRAVKELEELLGIRLIDRSTHHVALTPAGERLAVGARHALNLVNDAAQQAKSIDSGLWGTIKLGVGGSTNLSVIPRLMKHLRIALPTVRVQLHHIPVIKHIDAIRDGLIDVGIVYPPVMEEFIESQVISTEPIVAAIPEGLSIAQSEEAVTISDLAPHPFITYEGENRPAYHVQLWSIFAMAQSSPRIVHAAPSTEAVISIVACGEGVALVPKSAQLLKLEGVVFRDVAGLRSDLSAVKHAFGWHRDRSDGLLRSFIEASRSLFQSEEKQ